MTTTTSQAATAETLSDLFADLPADLGDANWTIEHGELARIRTADGRRGRVYWDTTDTHNEGWAYQIDGANSQPETSGPINGVEDIAEALGVEWPVYDEDGDTLD